MSDASAYLIQTKLSAAQREALLQDLFGREPGIGLSFVRIPMGASDFSRSHYSYDDRPAGETDSALAHFSIDADRAEKIPALKRAIAINPQLRLVGSPWSAPGWMKSTGSLIKGTLLPQFYGSFAEYFRRCIEAYERGRPPDLRDHSSERAALRARELSRHAPLAGAARGHHRRPSRPALRQARHSRTRSGTGTTTGTSQRRHSLCSPIQSHDDT